MEDKTMSASAANDSGFVQSNGNDGEVGSSTLGGGGQANVRMAKPSIVSYPAASWLEFTEWLERGLDEYGLEPTLYARCVLSILKQPPEPATDGSVDNDDEWTPTPAASFLSVVSHHVFGKNNSAPSSRKNSFGSLATAAAVAAANVKSDADPRKQALMECLKTVNGDEADLGKFVDDIVYRYSLLSKAGVLGEKQNESVDSGVCPSPEESFQNYDEAFPPLAADRSFEGSTTDVFVGETVGIRPRVASSSWLTGKRPADARVKSAVGNPVAVVDDDKLADDQNTSGRAQGDGSPVKRPKLLTDLMESETGGRTLHSCPDFVNSSSATAPLCTGKRATFCCPVVKKQSSVPHQSASVKIPPQFIIPKCWKVGSWPSRYDRSTKPAADVPFWSCSEWFCTVHKRLEFGLLNAKINGDTKSLSSVTAPATASASCCGNDRTTSAVNVDAGSQMDVEIFEIEPPLLPPPPVQQQQNWILGQTSSQKQQESEQQQQQAQVVPEMFDAPRFILHIINEDDTLAKENFFPPPKQNTSYNSISQAIKNASPGSDWASFFDQSAADDMLFSASQKMTDAQYGKGNSSPWAAPVAQSEFSFDAMDDNMDIVASAGILLPVDVSHLANTGVGFCLPKCVQSVTQQQQRQQQFLMPPLTTTAGVFNKLLESQAMEATTTSENINPRQHLQSVAVPIKDTTHFRPIRSESMEDAYFLKPGFDEFNAAIENIDDYYVYQQKEEPGASAIMSTTMAQACAGQQANYNGGQQRRSLPLKFRASKPDKMCQTEEFSPDSAEGEECTGGVTTLMERYRQEFEIWAFQPSEMRNCLHMSRWNLNESIESNDAMVVGPLSPHIDNTWLDELVGDDSPPVPQPKMIRDEQPIQPEIQYGLVDDGMVFPNQQPSQQLAPKADGQQQLEIWQQEDERYEDSLLRYVSNISLISPLDIQTTTV